MSINEKQSDQISPSQIKKWIKWGIISIVLFAIIVLCFFLVGAIRQVWIFLFGAGTVASAVILKSAKKEQAENRAAQKDYDGRETQIIKEKKTMQGIAYQDQLKALAKSENMNEEDLKNDILKNIDGYTSFVFMIVVSIIAGLVVAFFSSDIFAQTPPPAPKICFTKTQAKKINAKLIDQKALLAACQAEELAAHKLCQAKIALVRSRLENRVIMLEKRLANPPQRKSAIGRVLVGVGVVLVVTVVFGSAVVFAKNYSK